MSGVPDHRLEEVMNRLRTLEQENARLRGTLDATFTRIQPDQQEPEDSPFQPEVERALQQKFDRELKKRFQPIEQQTKAAIGALADQNDALRFALTYGQDEYLKYQDKIERLREERSRAGQWVSREDAYRHIYFEENRKKPTANPQPSASTAAPSIDPYTGLMREQAAVDTQPQQAPPQQQAAPQPPQEVKVEQTALPPLPPQAAAPIAPSTPQQSINIPAKLDIALDDKTMSAWADRYGDIPL